MMPDAVPPFDETLVKVMFSGVVPLDLLMLTAVAVPVLIAPLVVVMVPLLSVATKPLVFAVLLVMLSAAKVIVPVLFVRVTALPAELVTLVAPVTDKLPARSFTVRPVPALFVEERL